MDLSKKIKNVHLISDNQSKIINSKDAKKLRLVHHNLQHINANNGKSKKKTQLERVTSHTPFVPNRIELNRYLTLPEFVWFMNAPRKLTINELALLNVSEKYLQDARHMIFNPLTLSLYPD
ncbi:unnamed protein product [Brachionus calyciflorus]|uniref:Uncharacterized protein n=1 Tax=Brachionus calyciflorus TaxID=104777 RepID=A0A813Y9N2_9BILA|nr:unnamed protein product [Brachionus calyciflorus]